MILQNRDRLLPVCFPSPIFLFDQIVLLDVFIVVFQAPNSHSGVIGAREKSIDWLNVDNFVDPVCMLI